MILIPLGDPRMIADGRYRPLECASGSGDQTAVDPGLPAEVVDIVGSHRDQDVARGCQATERRLALKLVDREEVPKVPLASAFRRGQ